MNNDIKDLTRERVVHAVLEKQAKEYGDRTFFTSKSMNMGTSN